MRLHSWAACAALVLALSAAGPARSATTDDRWLEIDLYWFSADEPARSAAQFWDRYQPLFSGVSGYKGVVLNLGMLVDYVMEYRGDPRQAIPLPRTTGQELGAQPTGPLLGSTAERQLAWRQRFRHPENETAQVAYGPWTYGGLKELATALRQEGSRRGVDAFRVATLVTGGDGAYGEPSVFARAHPEAWTKWAELAPGALASSSHFDPNARLRADMTARAAFPAGWPADTLASHAFARQWGAISRAIGLDGIMLRDSFSYPRGFTRYGPWGAAVPDAATAARTTQGIARLIRESKLANPHALIMMWSTAATATSDWRANGIDLESIAGEGFLDIFVDQTWAGAWGEVGVRQQTYWNAPILGWTYQLAYLMQHAAILAKSGVRHYFLTETFDAWESWDTIHTAPGRLRWAIWAYSHVGVKTPTGLRMPAGSYVSWGNRGRELLGPEDVAFLAGELNAAARDAALTVEIDGPTVVYSRAAAAAQMERLPLRADLRDRIDEQIGSLIKWPLPVLSVTRAEWLARVRSDLFVFGATAGTPPDELAAVRGLAERGQAIAFFGGMNGATDPAVAALLGVTASPHRPTLQDRSMRATAGPAWPASFAGNQAFDAPPPLHQITAPPATVVYRFSETAGLVLEQSGGRNLSLWDPVPIFDYWYRPLRDLMNGDPHPFALSAAVLNTQLRKYGAIAGGAVDVTETGTFAAWRRRDGEIRLLAGDLEEGLQDTAAEGRRLAIALPPSLEGCRWRPMWPAQFSLDERQALKIFLAPQSSILLAC